MACPVTSLGLKPISDNLCKLGARFMITGRSYMAFSRYYFATGECALVALSASTVL